MRLIKFNKKREGSLTYVGAYVMKCLSNVQYSAPVKSSVLYILYVDGTKKIGAAKPRIFFGIALTY